MIDLMHLATDAHSNVWRCQALPLTVSITCVRLVPQIAACASKASPLNGRPGSDMGARPWRRLTGSDRIDLVESIFDELDVGMQYYLSSSGNALPCRPTSIAISALMHACRAGDSVVRHRTGQTRRLARRARERVPSSGRLYASTSWVSPRRIPNRPTDGYAFVVDAKRSRLTRRGLKTLLKRYKATVPGLRDADNALKSLTERWHAAGFGQHPEHHPDPLGAYRRTPGDVSMVQLAISRANPVAKDIPTNRREGRFPVPCRPGRNLPHTQGCLRCC